MSSRKQMTLAECRRIVAVKEGPCVACYRRGLLRRGCDAHHLTDCGRRVGHEATVGLCAWHHRAVPDEGMAAPQMRELLVPSLMDGSRTFRFAYGTNATLLELQERLLKELA